VAQQLAYQSEGFLFRQADEIRNQVGQCRASRFLRLRREVLRIAFARPHAPESGRESFLLL
jgi:hypothetical protein